MAISDEQLARINFLARKSRSQGLTEEEKAEQHALRRAYVDAVKASLTPLLESITVVDANDLQAQRKRDEPC